MVESKPTLLALELWGLGDLIIATPFLQAASREYSVTLIAKPFARDLHSRFWPDIHVVPFVAPWTAFRNKYRLHRWPWKVLLGLRHLAPQPFSVAVSARWDPRDHMLMFLIGAERRLGFPRVRSQILLTDSLTRPEPLSHRYENWRVLGQALGLRMPTLSQVRTERTIEGTEILIHTGAGQAVRVWPLDGYRQLIQRLRSVGQSVRVACDPDQREWWIGAGELSVSTPRNVAELLQLVDQARIFIGNDSGPAHIAAFCGVPTFTIFGPQLHEWFSPMHPQGECFEGRPCPYKPCSDYCRFARPHCLTDIREEELWQALERFLWKHSSETQRRMAFVNS